MRSLSYFSLGSLVVALVAFILLGVAMTTQFTKGETFLPVENSVFNLSSLVWLVAAAVLTAVAIPPLVMRPSLLPPGGLGLIYTAVLMVAFLSLGSGVLGSTVWGEYPEEVKSANATPLNYAAFALGIIGIVAWIVVLGWAGYCYHAYSDHADINESLQVLLR